jgi:uncharacterized lipoprotein YddW (UPF0748 family)
VINRRLALAGAWVGMSGCAGLPSDSTRAPVLTATPTLPTAAPSPAADPDAPPPAPREFRGAWVATVSNIDWPSAPGLSAATQRAEALALLDRARAIGLNALILQVRPAADAIYPSALEPWTEFLSGEQGKAPVTANEARWDPLAFWVEQAHQRGLELHAWINPYRARHSSAKSPLAASHIAVRRPDLVKRYGDMLWLDPGEPEAAAHTLAVVADVVRRYDIDGLHIDDYFYPYPVPVPGLPALAGAPPAPEQPFPDDPSYARYRLEDAQGGPLTREDWRRANVDTLVEAIHRTVRAIKPWVRFGVSPFGVGKPELRPAGITGFSQYDKLYADAERWLARGWLDYLAPQLYWQIGREGLQFPVLLDYWLAQNPAQRHVWPGLFSSQVGRSWPAREIVEQVAVQRSRAAAGGHIHFSLVALQQDRDGLATLLQMGPYAQPALVPATPWLASGAALTPSAAPRLHARFGHLLIDPGLDASGLRAAPSPTQWAVWRRVGKDWRFAVLAGHERRIDTAGAQRVSVSAVDRVGQLGPSTWLRLP